MGKGSFKPCDIPVKTDKEVFINEKIHVLDRDFNINSMLMGVPHTIIFVDEINMDEVHKYGPLIEKHEIFPQKTNVNFVKVIDQDKIY